MHRWISIKDIVPATFAMFITRGGSRKKQVNHEYNQPSCFRSDYLISHMWELFTERTTLWIKSVSFPSRLTYAR